MNTIKRADIQLIQKEMNRLNKQASELYAEGSSKAYWKTESRLSGMEETLVLLGLAVRKTTDGYEIYRSGSCAIEEDAE